MSWSVCAGCNRTFAGLKYLTDHLKADSNYGCYKAVCGSASASGKRTNEQTKDTRASKRMKAIQLAEAVLRQTKAQATQPSVPHNQDMSVLDYHNGDTDEEGINWPDESENGHNEVPQGPTTAALLPPTPTDPLQIRRTEAKEEDGTSKSLRDFQEYAAHGRQHYARLEPHIAAAAELMSLMNKKGGSIALYEAVMD